MHEDAQFKTPRKSFSATIRRLSCKESQELPLAVKATLATSPLFSSLAISHDSAERTSFLTFKPSVTTSTIISRHPRFVLTAENNLHPLTCIGTHSLPNAKENSRLSANSATRSARRGREGEEDGKRADIQDPMNDMTVYEFTERQRLFVSEYAKLSAPVTVLSLEMVVSRWQPAR
jgi:hypothetical protein